MVGTYTGMCDAMRRLSIQSNIMICYHMLLMVVLYYHFYNVCGIASSVSCMSYEMVDALMKTN